MDKSHRGKVKPEAGAQEEGHFQLSLSEGKGTESEASGSVSDNTINLCKRFGKIWHGRKFVKKNVNWLRKITVRLKVGELRQPGDIPTCVRIRGSREVCVGRVQFVFLFLFFSSGVCVSTTCVCGISLMCRQKHAISCFV